MPAPQPPRFALYSPLLPPAHGGQPVILQRMLEGIDPESYLLIGDAGYQESMADQATEKGLRAETRFVKYTTGHPRPIQRKSALLRFPFDAYREITGRARQITPWLREWRPHALVVCTGDLYGFPAACRAARLAGIPYIPYLFDDYAYQGGKFYHPLAKRAERHFLRRAAKIIVTNEAAQAEYRKRHGVESNVIHNAYPKPDLASLDRLPNPFSTADYNIVFAGSIYNAHYDAFRNLVGAIASLSNNRIKLHIYSPQAPNHLAAFGISGPFIVHHGLLPGSEVAAVERKADLLFLPLAFESPIAPLLKTSSPGKMAEYLAMGRPILVHAPEGTFVNQYFRQHKCGWVADSNEKKELAGSLTTMMGDPERGRQFAIQARERFETDFTVERAREQFRAVVDGVYPPEKA